MRTFVRNEDWRTEQTLWRSAAKVAPDSYRVCRSVAHALFESSGDEPPMDDVVRWAERSRAIVDSSPVPPVDRPRAVYRSLAVYYAAYGDLLARRGEQEKARARYESAAEALERVLAQEHGRGRAAAPGVIAEHSLLLGRTYLALARFEDALKVLDEADSIDPEDAVAYYLRGKAQLGRDSYDAAARSLVPDRNDVRTAHARTAGDSSPGGAHDAHTRESRRPKPPRRR
jgi:tetratricopeptide (TPR) repeat protein